MLKLNPATKRSFKRRESLPAYPQHLWLIESGAVRAYTLMEDGTIVGLGFWGVGDQVGQHLTCIQPYELECLTEVQARAIALDDCVDLSQTLLSHLYQAQELVGIRSGQVPLRLQRLLEWLSNQFGETHEQGKLINLRLTHQDIADALGTTRVTVTRLLNQFERERRICWIEQYLLLPQSSHSHT
ncbi:Crp/Fnr family transcriptional regulator [Thermoleptolyngbya sichuanensis A183]|uniref:Crp/Fnr family transcriptional regulator n=1 Tax=Thermoleptolyngbya sichuanensis A183 TaxID=2737172 RepID=A0A6M8B2K0_9CYAN|nr:Crp/Fnr family transcriptional regulator [Thermoleptolyngbya sichuanensis]QKD80974.1 Crp/Fnr family transcriptional regulator [Thermoleptolyngbya sichuanensis A183]